MAHEIAADLGPERATAWPMFHALTGCDTVSSFSGHGKKIAWTIWKTYPGLTTTLLRVSCAAPALLGDVFHSIERFVILMYDSACTDSDFNKAWKRLLTRKCNVQLIPPM